MEPARERVRAAYRKWQPVIPGDDWLAGIRISFPVPGGPIEPGSREGLPECRATDWWCSLIHMFILWQNRHFAKAEEYLNRALTQMPAKVFCVWGDVSMLIDDAQFRSRYQRMPCAERAALEDQLWWLTDPLFSRPGNERKVDHFARAVNLRLATELTIPEVDGYPYALSRTRRAVRRFSAGDLALQDLNPDADASAAEVKDFRGPKGLLQVAFESMRDADYRRANYSFMESAMRHRAVGGPTGGVASRPIQFVPAIAAAQAPFLSLATDWNLNRQFPLESGRSPVGPIAQLDAQHAFFMRGDSARLVVVSEPAADPLLSRSLMQAALAYSRAPGDVVVHRDGSRPRYEFSPLVPADSMVVSLELIALERGAGRVRFGAAPPRQNGGRIRLSDLLLFRADAAGALPYAALDSVLRIAHATTALRKGIKTGVFWEVYGLRSGDYANLEVTITRLPSGGAALRGERDALARAGQQPTTSVSWTDETATGNAIESRRVILDISRLEPGYYELALRMTPRGEVPVTTARRIQVLK